MKGSPSIKKYFPISLNQISISNSADVLGAKMYIVLI